MTHTRTKTYSRYIVIRGCAECPGFVFDRRLCWSVCRFADSRSLERPDSRRDSPPWCPLETGDVMVTKGP